MALFNGNTARTSPATSLLGGAREALTGNAPAAKEERKPSEFWLNVGVVVKGAGENGEDLFVTLPGGIALDDMKPQVIKGTKQSWIQLGQAKNALLEDVRQAGANLAPGEAVMLEPLFIELRRAGKPEQTGTAETNPLIGQMRSALRGEQS